MPRSPICRGSGPLQRIQHLGDYLDSDIGARALAAYKPAVPVTPEGFMWAIAGFLGGSLLVSALQGFVTLPFRWRNGYLPHRRVPPWRRRQETPSIETVTLREVEAAREQTQRSVEPPRFG